MDLAALKSEYDLDPIGLGYAGKTAQQKHDLIMRIPPAPAVGRRLERGVIEAHELFEAVDRVEYVALVPTDRQMLDALLSMGTVNLRGAKTRATLDDIFPALTGPLTRAAIGALRWRPASRAEVLGYDNLGLGNTEGALAL